MQLPGPLGRIGRIGKRRNPPAAGSLAKARILQQAGQIVADFVQLGHRAAAGKGPQGVMLGKKTTLGKYRFHAMLRENWPTRIVGQNGCGESYGWPARQVNWSSRAGWKFRAAVPSPLPSAGRRIAADRLRPVPNTPAQTPSLA